MIMSMNDMLRKMAVRLERKQDALFSYDVEKQKKYIAGLGDPKDEIERSYFQYKCQMQFNGKFLTFLLNVVSFPVAMLYLAKYGKNSTTGQVEKKDLVFFRDGKPANILPKSLQEQYRKIESDPTEGIQLTKKDKAFLHRIMRRYPFSWQFILKCLIKIGRYSYAISHYKPEAVAVCAEYSFTSSVLTAYCRQQKIRHIDVMHGEKMYYMRDSFFVFDACYVWDVCYADILTSLKADENQFMIEIPESLRFDGSYQKTDEYDDTYYLGAESEEVLQRIADSLEKLSRKGKRISLRPHPRYSDMESIRRLFAFANIEDPGTVTIEQSLMRTGCAISLYSTVLNQALCNGVPIVIDDISNPKNYQKLEELEYICLKKEHRLLSAVMEEAERC